MHACVRVARVCVCARASTYSLRRATGLLYASRLNHIGSCRLHSVGRARTAQDDHEVRQGKQRRNCSVESVVTRTRREKTSGRSGPFLWATITPHLFYSLQRNHVSLSCGRRARGPEFHGGWRPGPMISPRGKNRRCVMKRSCDNSVFAREEIRSSTPCFSRITRTSARRRRK